MMRQFVDKLISRIREEKDKDRSNIYSASQCDTLRFAYGHTIDIVNQLAEEYKGGWISVKDRLPELTRGTECFKQSELCLVTEEWWDGDTSISVGWCNQSGAWSNEATNCKVIAWMPLPEPYRKEGE